jgi:hypothetical protein
MDSKLGMVLVLVIIIILLWNYWKTKTNTNSTEISASKILSPELKKGKEIIQGTWLGGVIVIVDDSNDPMCMNVCYHNKNEHNTTPCHIVEANNNIIKLAFTTAILLPYISNMCMTMVYDKLNDVLVYKGRNIKDSLFDESRFNYSPTEIFVVVGRNSIQVLHTWNTTVVNSLRINGHAIENIDNSDASNYRNNYQRFMNSVFPTKSNTIVDCSTNIFDSLIFTRGKAYSRSNYIDKCEGPWLGGSINVKRINADSYEFCNLDGDTCSYARTEGNRFILNPTNDLIKGESKDNRLCNSLYYCPVNDLFIWYGDPCLKNYSDLDNNINSDIYMVIKRNELIFYIGNVDAINTAGPRLEEVNEVFNPMDVLIRPDI